METYSNDCCEGCGNGRKKFTGLFFLFFIIHLFTIHFIVDWLAGWLVDRQCTNRWVYVYSSCFAHVWYHVRSICMVYFQNISDNNSSAILCSILIIFSFNQILKNIYIFCVLFTYIVLNNIHWTTNGNCCHCTYLEKFSLFFENIQAAANPKANSKKK